MYCVCKKPTPLFEIGKPTFCSNCAEEIVICPAPVASPEEKSSSNIGAQWLIGRKEWDDLIQRQSNSESQLIEMNKAIQFLAEQVKTMVDALAEEQEDPDRPITSYMSGRPV